MYQDDDSYWPDDDHRGPYDDYGFDDIDDFQPVVENQFLAPLDWEPSDVELAEIEQDEVGHEENWWEETEPDDPAD